MGSIAWAKAIWRNGTSSRITSEELWDCAGEGQLDEERVIITPRPTRNVPALWIRPRLLVLSAVCIEKLIEQTMCRELEREKVWSRIHLVPMLMAEGDRDLYRRQQASLAKEREIMKDVPGWEVGDIGGAGIAVLMISCYQVGKSVYSNPKYSQNNIVVL
jgi:GRIM-19 protein